MPLSRDAFLARLMSLAHQVLCDAHRANWPAEPHAVYATDGRFRVYITIAPPLGDTWDCPCCRLLGGGSSPGIPDNSPPIDRGSIQPARRPATVNERMLAQLEADPERIGWSARKWASALDCTAGAVHAAPAWRRIMTARALNRAERVNRRG